MKKMICFDIDGTLLTSKGALNENALQAIRQLTERQDLVLCIATGRGPYMFQKIRQELGIDHYISYNGQYCVAGNQEILCNPLNPEQMQEVCVRAKAYDIPMGFMTTGYTKTTVSDHKFVRESFKTVAHAYPIVEMPDFHAEMIYQGQLFCTIDQEEQILTNQEYFRFVRWHTYAVDIIPPNGSKLEGIRQMAAHYGIGMKNVIAFGDGLNDLEMIEHAGFGICMGNGKQEVKEIADYITTDNDTDGIIRGLKYLQIL